MTVAELISLTRGHFDTFDSGEALTHLQAVHNNICRLVRVLPDESVDVSITAGASEYPIADLLRIWDAAYWKSATDSKALIPRSVDQMDLETHGAWRRDQSSTPVWYDERAGSLVLHPAPDTTTASGYPKVVLSVSLVQPLDMTTSLPAVADHEAWLYGLCRRYAAMKAAYKLQMFMALEQEAMNKLRRFSQGKAARQKPNLRPMVPRVRVV